ncbi:MAG: glycoside hydrolase family 9 protein, partial [Spirochaetia bacterium]
MPGSRAAGKTAVGLSSRAVGSYNYGEALQKAIYFYECQQAGPLPDWNRVEWRGDATMHDAVLGGWYDAGDHVKFNLPMAYTASMLQWAIYEYSGALSQAGQLDILKRNVKFTLDYLANCWDGNTYVYQIGSGSNDHSWWGPVEVIELESMAGNRPSYSASHGLSAVMAQTAAALALGYHTFGDSVYLQKAVQLFNRADEDRSDSNYSAASGYYDSWSGPIDELMWAAIWLYVATGDSSYLDKAESYVPLLNKQGQTSDIEYQWGHCWDDSHYGGLLMLAKLTGKQQYIDFIQMHLDWWANGAKGFTPGGLAWLDTWGSLRYATTAAFLAFVYSDWSGADPAKATAYRAFAEKQTAYALGDNERHGSYEIGFGTNSPQHPHHRTAHGSWADSQTVPPYHRHILYGALVGGPDQAGNYTDEISNYTTNEVACDYNAGFVGALAKMYDIYGGSPLSNFPQPEAKTHYEDDEFFVEAAVNSSGSNYSEIKALMNNRSAWPARVITNLKFRYFMDLSEVFAAG